MHSAFGICSCIQCSSEWMVQKKHIQGLVMLSSCTRDKGSADGIVLGSGRLLLTPPQALTAVDGREGEEQGKRGWL